MPLITEPPDLVDGETSNVTAMNLWKSRIYALVNGLFTNVNCDAAMALQRAKVADTAFVLGNTTDAGVQTVTRPSTVSAVGPFYESAQGGWVPDLNTANMQAVVIVGAAQTIALTAGKGAYSVTAAAAADFSLITGGTEGAKIAIVLADADVTMTHTAAATANAIRLRGRASITGQAGGDIICLRYSALVTGTGQWFEI